MRSLFLWAVGGLYFVLIFFVLSVALLLFPPRRIYPSVQFIFRIQLFLMGVTIEVSGLETYNHSRPHLFMGNHQSMFDLFAIPVGIPVHVVGLEAAYHFSLPLWGYLIRKWGNIPVYRNDLARSITSLETARRVMASGTSMVVLPEGHRTLSGKMGEFKKGPFHLALDAGADIIPFFINGLFEFKSKNSWKLNPTRVTLKFGTPIPYESFKNNSLDTVKKRIRCAMEQLEEESQTLTAGRL
jgi:1-acyl-sn-glycerol-3-phosphate acyltransferase